jgi:PIN domain nuclease of toxin-antitoxin system
MIDAGEVFVSAASIWEIAIKAKLGRLEGNPKEFVAAIDQSGFQELVVSARHAAAVYDLPFRHRDPFDRLLIAQTLTEPMRLLTTDSILGQYSELVMIVPVSSIPS